MAKIHLDRLRKRYEHTPVKGPVYENLVKQIIFQNTKDVQNKVGKLTEDRFKSQAKKYRTDRETRLVLPDLSDVLPKHAIQARKAAEKGKLLRDTLRDRITKALRERLETLSETTGEQNITSKRGPYAGRIRRKLVEDFSKDLKEIFTNYTKKDPKFGIPSNIENIARTEIRSAIAEIKQEYTNQFIDANPDMEVSKTWIQNRHLSKQPRIGHTKVHQVTIPFNDTFGVPFYEERNGRWIQAREDIMIGPHDPSASADQVIGCNCDLDIRIRKKKKVKQ